MRIHPSAIVDPKAEIHSTTTIGPYCIVERGARLEKDVVLEAHVVVHSGTTVGEGTRVSPNAVLGGPPQSAGFDLSRPTRTVIGARCVLREACTVHRATHEETPTRIGDEVMLQANSHVGHDCSIGNGVIITSYVGISGHCMVEDYAVIGGFVGIHQRVRIGTMAMVAGWSRVSMDCPPYIISAGVPCEPHGLNLIALKRRGVSAEARAALKTAYRLLYRSGLTKAEAIARIRDEGIVYPEVAHLLEFVETIAEGTMGRGLER